MQRKGSRSRREQLEQKSNSNRLVGWLVSYAHDNHGKAYEIRSGRTFISSVDSSDDRVITVDEQSVSAPHSAMKASPTHEVVLQDIFTDGGTFIRRPDQETESRVTGPVKLAHGDWLRFGQAEPLQVCLIDGPKR